MGKRGKELAKQRRAQRLQEISELRRSPYSPSERWWSSETVAAVTGANRGIGFEIARQLAGHGLHVVVAARDAASGQAVAEEMREAGLNVDSCQLDVTSEASIEKFVGWIMSKYGGLDILVNNAGVNFNLGSDNSILFAEDVINTNYFGTKRVVEATIPIMKPSTFGARILNVSSRLGRANGRRNRLDDICLREQLLQDDCLSVELIDGMVVKFLEDVKSGSWSSNGWPQMFTDYSVSKLAVNCYTRLMSRKLSRRPDTHKIFINCYCPGWVRTSMTGWQGNVSPEVGADTGVWAVLLHGKEGITGKFFAERREISF